MVKATRMILDGVDKGLFLTYEDALKFARKLTLKYGGRPFNDIEDEFFDVAIQLRWNEGKVRFENTTYLHSVVITEYLYRALIDVDLASPYIKKEIIAYDTLSLISN